MLTFKDWLYTHKFSNLELEILKNIELDSIDLIIFDRKERFGYQRLSSHKYELTIFNAKYIRVITFVGNCLDNIINEFLWWINSD